MWRLLFLRPRLLLFHAQTRNVVVSSPPVSSVPDASPAAAGAVVCACPCSHATNSGGLKLSLAAVMSDIKSLRKKWTRDFRLCISSEPAVVIESSAVGETAWAPLVVLDATSMSDGLVKAVDASLVSHTEKQSSATVLDLRERGEDISTAKRMLEEQFPSLRLNIDHSKGTDLQGVATHTVTVSLNSRDSVDKLSSEEKAVKNAFFGESIGVSYSSTARRAIFEGFKAAGLPQPPRYAERNHSISELSVYMDIIRNATCEEVNIVPTNIGDGQVRVSVQTLSGRQISALTGKHENALPIALSCVEKAADIVSAVATEGARKRIADHPVILALPPKGIRPKEILRRLLHHSFGIEEDRVLFVTLRSTGGTFVTNVDVELGWCKPSPAGAATDELETKATPPAVVVTVAKAAGVNKKAAEALASMSAIRECFPRVFEEQLAFHPEVREIMSTTKATVNDSICPHVSKGIVEQLRWAARRQKKEIVLEGVQLLPNSENESLGIRTTRPLWATQLFMVDEEGCREFICLALDQKKSASEQKAIAIALFKHFKEECQDGVQYAMDHGLIDKNGDVSGCEGIYSSATPLPKSAFEMAAESDPFIQKLQLLPSQPILVPPRQSMLSVFRRGIQLYVDMLGEKCGSDRGSGSLSLVENVEQVADNGHFKVQLYTKWIGDDTSKLRETPHEMSPLGEAAYSATAVSALFTAMKSLFEEGGLIVCASSDDAQINEICLETWRRVAALPSLPPQLPTPTPLETIAECVMTKYGLSTELRISGVGKAINVQLYGRCPTSLSNSNIKEAPQFFLGHGRGSSLLKAAVSCCQRVFVEHMQSDSHPLGVMGAEPQISGSVGVRAHGSGSLLASRIEDVKKELVDNKTVAADASVLVKVDVCFSQSERKYEASLYVVDGARTVELERISPDADLMMSLLRLTESINKEMGLPSIDKNTIMKKCDDSRQLIALKNLVGFAYGFPVIVETSMKDSLWYCHISVLLSDNIHYGIGYAVSKRKKDAVEEAAAGAIHRCFGTVTNPLKKGESHAEVSSSNPYCGFVYEGKGNE
ncbi:hypothetical protein, conserved [Trypanosoma brucei gambiense DAL972]|uniref:DRBM domain-containing protein n=1 Tax=Trypanosoma brucei gambiense (strain MHOM/CI/86/DAL972) TaxID=679716 RepID=D0A5E5_TRYB9|nr:hypothetical protein, conserved [Trypanosoma brucei gambiense DAL972]CBH16896.1 hypothetical protein, conserved [Trypanosoma brucei gambiense DAL972]|eukprot:XP_011779160.1 hypothetical protein, conserved [Trypanosoma brucei gambiense DAL972]